MGPRTKACLAVLVVVVVGGCLALFQKIDTRKRALDDAMAVFATCSHLRIGMGRDDVERLMGKPRKEYPTAGENGAQAQVLLFALPIKINADYPWVKLERGLLVQARCSLTSSLSATARQRVVMFGPAGQAPALGTDAVRR